MCNTRKGIVEFIFGVHCQHEFVWFSTLPGILATEIVLEAHIVF